MDLPPRFRRHPRYGNVPHPPHFVHPHLTPLAPPSLPPSPPRILLPPLPPPRHEGQRPFPSHFSSPPYLPTLERSYFQELDPLRKPYLDLYRPPHQDNSPFRIIHDYSLRNSIIEDEIFRRGCSNNYAYDFPRTWGQELPCGATEGNSWIFEMEHRRYSTSRVSGIEARDMWKDTNADARRWESWDHGSHELYFEREDDDRRWDCGIDRGRELCFGRNIDSRRRECVISGGCELSFDRDDNRIRLDYGINDGISLQLENRQQEFLESNLGLHRFSDRLGREGSKREFHRPRKMNRVQKKSGLHRIRLGKAHRRHIRGKKILNNLSSSSLRGRDKENFECLETLAKDNQETEQSPVDLSISFKSNSLVAKAILAASSPVSKEEICLSSRNQKIRKINNMVDTGSDNSRKVVTEQIPGFQSGALCPRIELLEKFNVSGNEKVTAYKVNSSGDNFLENEASKDMHSQCLDNFRSGSSLGRRSKKKRRSGNNILHGMRLLLSEDSGEIVNFETPTFTTSDASKLNTNSTLSRVDMSSLSNVLPEADLLPSLGSIASEKVDIGSDTNRPSFSDRKMKDTSLNNFSASLPMSDDASTECSAKDADWASQMGTDEVTGHAGGLCLANEKIGHGDGFGFQWHADSVELHVRKWGSISDLEKNLLDSKDLLTGLGAVRVDSTDEQPFQNGLVFENAFDEVPFKCPPSVQVEDITGLSRHHESNIPTVTRSNFLSADHKGTVIEADISLAKTDNQSCKDGANLCNKSGCIEGASESKIKRRRKRKRKRKRKAGGTQMGSSGSNATEPVDKGSSVGDELANLLATDISSVKEADFPGAEDNFEVTFRLKEGPSVDNQSYKDGANLCNKSGCIEGASESKIKRKRKRKRKARGTQMGISGSNATEPVKGSSVGDELANLLATDISSVEEADFLGADNSEMTFRLKEGPSVDNQPYKDGANLCNKSGCIEGASESKIKRKRKRKRKASSTQMGISGSNATQPVDKGSSVGDELANLLATDISSVKEAAFPGTEDNSKLTFRLKEGTSVDQDSHLDAVDFSGDGSFPGNIKKRKVVSPRLNFSSCLVDDSIGCCLASDDLKLDQVSFRPTKHDADQSEETLSAMHVASTDGNENFSIPDMDGAVAYGNNNLHLKDDLAFIRNTLSTCADGSDDCATQSGDELVAPGFDTPSCISSPEDLLSHTDFHSESEMIFEGFQTSKIKPVSGNSTTFSLMNSIENATSGHLQMNNKVPPPLPQKTDKVPSSKNKPTSAVPNIYGYPAFNFHTSRNFPSTHFSKSRTWHRTEQSSINVSGPTMTSKISQSYVPKTSKISQNSYVRKGNSLVRKSSSGGTVAHTPSSSVYPTSPCMDYIHNNQVKADTPCIPRIGQVNSSESSQSLPLNHTGRSLRSASCHSVASLPVTNSLRSCGPAKTLDALKETVKSFEIPECQTGSGNNSDGLSTLGKENLGKKISYVKRRSNQLIATSDPKDSSTSGLDKSEASLSDGYYKNSKNQLIRVSSESHVRKGDSIETLNSHRLGSHTILPISSGKRQSSKGFSKTYRLSKFSLVWNLNGAQFPDKSSNSLGPRKVWPYLLPWRKATNRRSSLPTISQKLLLSSKRGAIYTRSTHGYSLRISKVLSVCGRSLKWSKSIERNSKKANEDSTRAVVAAEKRKKEEKDVISVLSKSRNHVSRKSVVSVKLCTGERIFRIGSERYKMDPSRRSLHRITEMEEPSPSDVLQSEKNLKKSYLPKRLLIGNDEYVRIGTGNQLVRDPKKRTRVLASEKVRWSLRTARLRLARKRKYCQFFTRFGKCNKSDGKCPYIHDPSKIVVCTKFVNGSCTDSDCKLTHKVIPERMPDCSYFLKGSCSNENCPYRHVNVNPESSICKRFLRGYCADGNECRKKHTYVCPAFESTGICPQLAMCKLHHPKKKTENKPVIEQKIVRGRYFDGGLIDIAECSMATDEKLSAKGEDDKLCEEGKYPDYISLDISNDGPEMSVL